MKDNITIENMREFGGSFVRALAVAAVMADQENYNRLVAAFPDLFRRYAASGWQADRPSEHRPSAN